MVKSPKIRHSKVRRDPVTIDLDPKDVSRAEAAETMRAQDAPAKPSEPASPASAGTAASDAAGGKDASVAAAVDKGGAGGAEIGKDKAGPAFGRGGDAPKPVPPKTDAGTASGAKPEARKNAAPHGSGGGARTVLAGVIGGIVALAGAGALQYAGVLPAPGGGSDAAISSLQAEVETLRQAVADAGADGTDGSGEMEARIAGIASATETLKSEVASLQAANSSPEAGNAAAMQALEERLAALEAEVSDAAQAPGADAALGGRIDSLEAGLAAATQAATAQGDRMGALEQRLATLSDAVRAQAENPRIARAIAASGLKAAIDRGVPFMAELETFASVAPDAPEVAALRELAASGVPTREAIAAQVGEAVGAMIRATQAADPDAGFVERLYSSAQSLVTVRPVGEVEGEGVPAIAARMEAAIKAGDYARAIGEYDSLPDAAKAAGADLIAGVRARMNADELVGKALAGALKG